MRRNLLFFLIGLVLFSYTPMVHAFTITSDPQYVVMDFASINDLNWSAPEDVWQKEVKPKIKKELGEFTAALPHGTTNRKLAWSTLMEYMNFPMDTPSEESPYVIKMRRILEITDEINLPLFVPLNGFQWWDNLPELYNWWDPDGTHTDAAFFNRQKNPEEFKKRFIAGYNPDNKWNVEWQDYQTPMKLNVRNWGGGGFRLAPPPNLLATTRSTLSYRKVLEARYQIILNEIKKGLDKWQQEGKQDLYAGITIGTEVSLNASITPTDEFIPYGYRGIQDLLCPQNNPTCGVQSKWNQQTLDTARRDIVHSYLEDMAMIALRLGIPKQRIYTHVWGESLIGEPRYASYANGAFTIYARPGMSFYSYAKNPLSLFTWAKPLASNGYSEWGAVEYSTDKTTDAWETALTNTLDSPVSPAKVVTIYNWGEHKGTPAIPVLKKYLTQDPKPQTCQLAEFTTSQPQYNIAPDFFVWNTVSIPNATNSGTLTIHIAKGDILRSSKLKDTTLSLNPTDQSINTSEISQYGLVSWFVESRGCGGEKRVISEPHVSIIPKVFPSLTVKDQLMNSLANVLFP